MQRDVPGIDHAYLAMDTEEGVEVVWNEVQFSEKKDFKSQEVWDTKDAEILWANPQYQRLFYCCKVK